MATHPKKFSIIDSHTTSANGTFHTEHSTIGGRDTQMLEKRHLKQQYRNKKKQPKIVDPETHIKTREIVAMF
jgi:hypothetical protein